MSLSSIKVNNSSVIGVDVEPTAGSRNLVESRGVFALTNSWKQISFENTINLDGAYNAVNHIYQTTALVQFGFYSVLFQVQSNKAYKITPQIGQNTIYAFIKSLPVDGQDIDFAEGNIYLDTTEERTYACPKDAVYLMVTYNTGVSSVTRFDLPTIYESSSISSYYGLLDFIGTTKNERFGDTTNNIGTQNVEGSSSAIFTTINSQSNCKGFLKNITVNWSSPGTVPLYVGLLDQRRNMVNHRKYQIEISSVGLQTIDLSHLYIAIDEGEQIFIGTNFEDNCYPKYKELTEDISCQAMSSSDTEGNGFLTFYEQAPSLFTHGVSISLCYTVTKYDGVFCTNDAVKTLATKVNTMEEKINLSRIVYDSNNNPYKIIVSNGQLLPKSLLYKKVLALGNSLTNHPYNANLGWLTQGYSMAATREETSWTSQFEKILKRYTSSAVVIPFNILPWEQNPAIDPSTITNEDGTVLLSSVLSPDIDCIIFRAGENNATTTQTQTSYEAGLTSLINYLKQNCQTADIIISSLMWHNTMKDTAFQNVAESMNLKYIDTGISGDQRETLGDFCIDRFDNYFPIIDSGVAAHVNDYGFYVFANIVANSLGLSVLEEQHTINIQASISYFINRRIGVKDGIVTIQTYGQSQPSISVTDSENNMIAVVNRDMSQVAWGSMPSNIPTYCSTFIMPDSDVNVIIS